MAGKLKQKTRDGSEVTVDGVNALSRLDKHEAEKQIIGLLLNSFDYCQDAHQLTPEHFALTNARLAFEQIMRLSNEGVRPEFQAVLDRLQPVWVASEQGCTDFLLDCVASYGDIVYLESYVDLLKDSYTRRQILKVCSETIATVMQEDDPQVMAGKVEQLVLELTKGGTSKGTTHISDGLISAYNSIMQAFENPKEIIGIPTGLEDLDAITKGWKGGELIVVGARPGMGKTSVATHAILHAIANGYHVLSVNMEMPGEQSMYRFIADRTGISVNDMRTGKLDMGQMEKIQNVVGRLSSMNLWYSNESSQSIHTITSMARRLHAQGKLDLLVIDYLQLVETEGDGKNSYVEVGKISRALKILANTLDIPVIVLAQLSRALEARGDKRPLLSDLRDSGKIEADADMVIFLYRDVVYKPDTERPHVMEAIVAKNRNGNTGTADLYWNGATMSVRNLQRQTIDL